MILPRISRILSRISRILSRISRILPRILPRISRILLRISRNLEGLLVCYLAGSCQELKKYLYNPLRILYFQDPGLARCFTNVCAK
jgi:hypothetical protein